MNRACTVRAVGSDLTSLQYQQALAEFALDWPRGHIGMISRGLRSCWPIYGKGAACLIEVDGHLEYHLISIDGCVLERMVMGQSDAPPTRGELAIRHTSDGMLWIQNGGLGMKVTSEGGNSVADTLPIVAVRLPRLTTRAGRNSFRFEPVRNQGVALMPYSSSATGVSFNYLGEDRGLIYVATEVRDNGHELSLHQTVPISEHYLTWRQGQNEAQVYHSDLITPLGSVPGPVSKEVGFYQPEVMVIPIQAEDGTHLHRYRTPWSEESHHRVSPDTRMSIRTVYLLQAKGEGPIGSLPRDLLPLLSQYVAS